MPIDVENIATEEAHTSIEQIVNGDGTATISYLDDLRNRSRPTVERIADILSNVVGARSEIHEKSSASAQDKSKRPSVLAKYPWFTLAHLRDYLRFRTFLDRASQFEASLAQFERLQRDGEIAIVKIDTEKLARPGLFGWRMIAVDIRIVSTGMLVEHYMTLRDLIEVNEAWLHKVYEQWRPRSTDDMTSDELRALDRDARFSRHSYRELLFDAILKPQTPNSPLVMGRQASNDAIVQDFLSTLNLR